MRLGNCRLLWKMPSAVTGVNIITNRKHVVHRDTRRGFSSRYVFVSNNFDTYKILPKSPKNIFNVDNTTSYGDKFLPSDNVMSAETGITDHFLLQRILTYILRFIPLQIPEVFSR